MRPRFNIAIFQVHIIFVPEEELGGMDGMRLFVHTDHFKELNLGFALDEGIGNHCHRQHHQNHCFLFTPTISKISPWICFQNWYKTELGNHCHHHQIIVIIIIIK